MDKEKEIKELEQDICASCCSVSSYMANMIATDLIKNAGYRKADEVRKEVAKDMITDIRKCSIELVFDTDFDEVQVGKLKGLFNRICKYLSDKHVVEVDE